MGKNRRGRRGKKSNKTTGPTTGEVCSSTGEQHHSSDEHDETTDIACYVFTDDGFYTTKDPAVIAKNNRDMETPAPPLYIKCKGKKWRDLHQELTFKAMFELTVKCVTDDVLELQLANMYDYKAVKPKIAKYVVPEPGSKEEKKMKANFEKKEKAAAKEKTEDKKKTEETDKEKNEETDKTEEVKTVKKKTKPVKALLQGLPWLCDEEGVRDALLYDGFGDVAVKLHNRTNKKKPPLFILAVDTGEDARRRKDADKIFELKKLLGFQVTVEPLPEEFDPKPQCFKCQQEGHVAKYCRNRAVCVKCAGFHDSRTCPLKKDAPPTCARCRGPHVASWRGCPAFRGLQMPIFALSSDEMDSSDDEDILCSEEDSTAELVNYGVTLCLAKRKRRRRRLRKPPCVLQAQQEAAKGKELGETKEKATCTEEAKDETAEKATCTEEPREESAEQADGEVEGGEEKKKRRRRRRKRGKAAEPGEGGETATAASPPPDAPEDPAGGGGEGPRKQDKVAAVTARDNTVCPKELENDIVAAVSRLVQERLSVTVLETVQAALKATK